MKKNIIYIVGAIALLFLLFKDRVMKPKIVGNAPEGFKLVKDKHGSEFAKDLERLFRLETAHFKSGQWLRTGTAGMEATSKTYPYGWGSLDEFAKANKLSKDDFFIDSMKDNHTGKDTNFIGFKQTKNSVLFTSWFIKNKRKGDILSWYRLPNTGHDSERLAYRNKLNKIETHFV